DEVNVGSKKFTESVILGEMAYYLLINNGINVIHKAELGGTQILFKSLVQGELDIYPEYTGTILQEILAGESIKNEDELKDKLASMGILMSEPLGFNNSYVIGMKKEIAEKLNINKVSDLRNYPELKFGFSNEFMDREDGWPSLQRKYNLPQRDVRGIDHDIGYRGLENGSIDVIDLYATDAEIDYYNLKSLEDDLNHFPEYQAVFLYRSDLVTRNPELVKSLLRLEGIISESAMIKLNAEVKLAGKSEGEVASRFLERELNVETEFYQVTIIDKLIQNTYEHLFLVVISLSAAIIIAIPLGIVTYKIPRFGQLLLGLIGVIQTIPSLALIVFMIPLLGIGAYISTIQLRNYSKKGLQ
ncbi:amino acid ABC transporter permease, partial [Candidatus Marinimicrobia bacterium MT.SAG.4]